MRSLAYYLPLLGAMPMEVAHPSLSSPTEEEDESSEKGYSLSEAPIDLRTRTPLSQAPTQDASSDSDDTDRNDDEDRKGMVLPAPPPLLYMGYCYDREESKSPLNLKLTQSDEPEDLTVAKGPRCNGSTNVSIIHHKRERLEETVNHIRRYSSVADNLKRSSSCSSLRHHPLPAHRSGPCRTGSDVDLRPQDSAEEDATDMVWRPEDIFFLSSKKGKRKLSEDDCENSAVSPKRSSSTPYADLRHIYPTDQDMLMQRLMHLSSLSLLAAGNGELDASLQSARQSAYLPWMAYTYYAQLLAAYQQGASKPSTPVSTAPPPKEPSTPEPDTDTEMEMSGVQDPCKSQGDANASRRRAPRALTGKHVKHGTGASPSTLLTLRQKIEQRQRIRELIGFSQTNTPSHRKKQVPPAATVTASS